MSRRFIPDFHFDTVLNITPDFLAENIIQNLLLDVDCTLKRYSESNVSEEVQNWLSLMKTNSIGLCLLSNGLPGRISKLAEKLQLPFFAPAMKPSARGCLKALHQYDFSKENTAIIGDQIFADIWAGNRAGIRTIHVTPLHPEEEPFFTRVKRPFEKLVLRSQNFPR